MIDFHTHILPGMDDGASTPAESLALLREERRQGVRHVFLTPHFYGDEESPAEFLRRRAASFAELKAVLSTAPEKETLPALHLGAEVYYFPGLSDCAELLPLSMGQTGCLLIEPPMAPWSASLLEDIEAVGSNLRLVPVIAHVDRYCRLLGDDALFERIAERKILIQVNASFFLRGDSSEAAMERLERGAVHFLGSDCHRLPERGPNLGEAARRVSDAGHAAALKNLMEKNRRLLNG